MSDLINPITNSRIKKGGKTHMQLVKGGFLDESGTVLASATVIAHEKDRMAIVVTKRAQHRRLLIHSSVEERIDLALADIKTVEQAVRVTAKVCGYVKATFASDIKNLSEGIGVLNVSGV